MNAYKNTSIDNLEGEVWRPILDYDSKYFVSNYARVKSLKHHQEIILTQSLHNGYLRVELWKNGKRKSCAVSRLVAQAFVSNDDPANKTTVDHIDGDKTRNTPDNLQWLSLADNIRAFHQNNKK